MKSLAAFIVIVWLLVPAVLSLAQGRQSIFKDSKPLKPPADEDKASKDLVVNDDAVKLKLALVEANIAESNWRQAERSLKSLKGKCIGQACHGRFNFAYGYFFQQRYSWDKEVSHLDSAIFFYNRVLNLFPENIRTLENVAIAYRQKNQPLLSVQYLEKAALLNNEKDYKVYMADLYLEGKDTLTSLARYQDVIQSDPSLAYAHERVVDIFNQYSNANPDDVFSYCRLLRQQEMSDLAANAILHVLKKEYLRNPAAAEKALFWWLVISSERSTLDLDVLPSDWQHKGLKELRDLWKWNSTGSTFEQSWWQEEEAVQVLPDLILTRKVVFSKALKYRSQQYLYAGDVNAADWMLESAYKVLTFPHVEAFLYRTPDIPDIFFEVASARALLYTNYPEIKGAREKFSIIEDELFSGKNQAYLDSDKQAIVKFHTTLGLIYAARNEWQGGGVRNATFQLSRAIEKSDKARNTAHLNMLLARGLLKTGSRSRATEAFLAAAMNYLNGDNLDGASKAMTLFDSLVANKPTLYTQVKSVLNYRSALQNNELENSIDSIKANLSQIIALTSDETQNDFFFAIQRFKMLIDLGNLAQSREKEKPAVYYHSIGLQQSEKLNSLSNATDVQRLNSALQSVATTVRLNVSREADRNQYKIWKVFDTATFSTKEVERSKYIFPAAHIAEAYAVSDLSRKAWPVFVVGNGTIFIDRSGKELSQEGVIAYERVREKLAGSETRLEWKELR
jgi:hypothetical protein